MAGGSPTVRQLSSEKWQTKSCRPPSQQQGSQRRGSHTVAQGRGDLLKCSLRNKAPWKGWGDSEHVTETIETIKVETCFHSVPPWCDLCDDCLWPCRPSEREVALRQQIERLKRDRANICLLKPGPGAEGSINQDAGIPSGSRGGHLTKDHIPPTDSKTEKASLFYELISVKVGVMWLLKWWRKSNLTSERADWYWPRAEEALTDVSAT